MAAVYVLALQVTSSRTVALVGALFTGFDLAMAEMLVTGVEPLVGWGAIILVLVGVLRLRDGWEPKGIALVAGGIVASAYTSMTASGVGGLLLPVLAVALAVTDKRAGVLVRAALPALAGIVLALPALPAYIGTRPGLLDYGGELVYYAPRAIDYVVLLWALGVAAGVVRMTDRRDAMRVLALAGVLLATLTLFRSTDEVVINLFFRPAYYVPVFLWIETAWLLLRIPRWRWYAIGGLFAFVLLLYPMVFSGQVTYSSFATPEFVQVVQLHRSSRTSTPTTGRWSRTVGARTVDRRPYRQSHLSVLRPQREPAQPPGRLPDGAGASKALRPVGCGGVNWRCVDETRPTKTEPTWKAAPGPLGATTTSWPRARSPQAPR